MIAVTKLTKDLNLISMSLKKTKVRGCNIYRFKDYPNVYYTEDIVEIPNSINSNNVVLVKNVEHPVNFDIYINGILAVKNFEYSSIEDCISLLNSTYKIFYILLKKQSYSSQYELLREAEYQCECLQYTIKNLKNKLNG